MRENLQVVFIILPTVNLFCANEMRLPRQYKREKEKKKYENEEKILNRNCNAKETNLKCIATTSYDEMTVQIV